MPEKIRLKVKADVKQEYASQGNFEAKLKPGKIITTENRGFAAYLVDAGLCYEVSDKKVDPPAEAESDIPAEFPGRKHFVAAGLSFEQVKNLTSDELNEVDRIGDKTIADINAFLKINEEKINNE